MGAYKVEQHRLIYKEREFHFVSYDARPANERRGEEALPPMWFLMSAGRRVPVLPQTAGQDPERLERAFREWLDHNVFAETDTDETTDRPARRISVG